ncbi:SusC/RagA family TonB-linked outer membrane protein [Chryseobacterium sp. cx-311]|uniref:SusC/RagA family TonB-linked outer membrane protein n=1 Tax=Marnyiella aurantia TaxID=2758037 RepID=UPI001AE142F3|nr:SusC/RagA family TonB-linked outer membrane protein [Marnyiella aurantia]MBP0613954.1 SusC/RagA family TonB-linked outer membrane protein [Marnyiella aurantia]
MKKNLPPLYGAAAFLMLSAFCSHTRAQTLTVSGTVTHNGQPLSGVTVSQEGSTQATVTNTSGRYQLTVSGADPGLIFRHPNHPLWREEVAGRTVVDVELGAKVQQIQEVTINAGYYTVKDKERTGSIAKVTAKDIENQPVTNVLSALQGRMAGVSIVQTSGLPGGGYDIQIRGRNSLRTLLNSTTNGNQPLYIVDGLPWGSQLAATYSAAIIPLNNINPLNTISPNDIEAVEILKDADATAIYGSRGANGVVLITTKKARTGKVGFTVNSSYGFSNSLSNLKMMDTPQYLQMRRQAFANNNISVYPATAYDVNGTWDGTRYTDWRETLIGHTAELSNTQLSLSGGTSGTKFMVNAGHEQQGTVLGKNFRYRMQSISGSLQHRSADSRFIFSMNNVFSTQQNNTVTEDITRASYNLAPNAPALYHADGSLNWENNTFTNPVAAFNASYSYENKQFLTSLKAEYSLMENLILRLNGGITNQIFTELSMEPNTIYNPGTALGASSANSRTSKSDQDRFSFVMEPQLNWKIRKGPHQGDVLVGATYQQEESRKASMRGVGFESNLLMENIAAAQTKTVNDQIETQYRYGGFFGRINYSLAKRYFLNLTGRRDGSSRFGTNRKFANFGAVGAAWVFSGENWLDSSGWLSFGKLRGSYGVAGSDNIGDYQYLNTYTVSSMIYNGITGLLPSRLYNPDYSWERTLKLEAAVELGFFNNRLNLTAAWYRNRSSNQLVGYQLPAVTGFSSIIANLPATVENKGVELEINASPLSERTLKWDTGFNISVPQNRLLAFPGLEGSTYANQFVIGEPTSIVKLYQLEGIDPATGKYVFTDFNGDGKIASPDDNKVIAKVGVEYFGGWTNRLQYGGWDLSFLVQFVKQQGRNYNNIMPSPGLMTNLPEKALDVWSPQNPDGLYMPYSSVANPQHSLFQNSTASVSDASYLRLKNVQLGYRIPLRNSPMQSVKLYVQGQNVYTHTRYFGIDPEILGIGSLPPLRTFTVGAQLNF